MRIRGEFEGLTVLEPCILQDVHGNERSVSERHLDLDAASAAAIKDARISTGSKFGSPYQSSISGSKPPTSTVTSRGHLLLNVMTCSSHEWDLFCSKDRLG